MPKNKDVKTIRFTVEGYRHGSTELSHKRGVALEIDDYLTIDEYLALFKTALDAIYRHEEERIRELEGRGI